MNEYTCYTRQGKWKLVADSDMDAMRTALYYCWRDDEDFIRLEFRKGAENYTLSIYRQQPRIRYNSTMEISKVH